MRTLVWFRGKDLRVVDHLPLHAASRGDEVIPLFVLDLKFGTLSPRTVTDGDWANNNAGWQWSAGCGSDAQPYFRIFNPVSQGDKFDPSGDYVRAWLPELARLPSNVIHAPWLAPPSVLSAAGVDLGRTYPAPVVDHAEARRRFIAVARAHLGAEK
jgi:deoxyribodipyrimidine photolyase